MIDKTFLRSLLSSPPAFFIITFTWSWLFWGAAIFLGAGADDTIIMVLEIAAGIGPMIAGIGLIWYNKGSHGLKDFLIRLFDTGRIGHGWYLVIFLIAPVLTALATLAGAMTAGGNAQGLSDLASSSLWSLALFAVFTLFFGPVPEEIGRFGHAIDVLQSRYSALVSSLLLGTAWAVWHLPLFFINGTYQHGLGFGSTLFWIYLIVMIPENIVMTWVYNNAGRSVLSAVLIHFMINFTGELALLSVIGEAYLAILWTAVAVSVCVLFGTKTMKIRDRSSEALVTAEHAY